MDNRRTLRRHKEQTEEIVVFCWRDGEAHKDSWVAFLTHSFIDGSELNAFHIKYTESRFMQCSKGSATWAQECAAAQQYFTCTWRTIIYCTCSCVLEQKWPVVSRSGHIVDSKQINFFYLFFKRFAISVLSAEIYFILLIYFFLYPFSSCQKSAHALQHRVLLSNVRLGNLHFAICCGLTLADLLL